MQMVSPGSQPIPQWNSTGGINIIVVNTLCVANTGGKFEIMGGTKNKKKQKKKLKHVNNTSG